MSEVDARVSSSTTPSRAAVSSASRPFASPCDAATSSTVGRASAPDQHQDVHGLRGQAGEAAAEQLTQALGTRSA